MSFDFERLDVYHLSLEGIDCCIQIIAKMPRSHGGHAEQLKRAATSVSLNTAEGSGEFKQLEKARFYRMALRSVAEVCANVQIGHRIKIVSHDDYLQAYALYTRVAKMLTKLVTSVEGRNTNRERESYSGVVHRAEKSRD